MQKRTQDSGRSTQHSPAYCLLPHSTDIAFVPKFLAVILGLALLAGCQQDQSVEYAPPPSLQPPVVQPPPPPRHPGYTPPRSTTPLYRVPYRTSPQVATPWPRNWIPNAPGKQWKWIVIHHSDTAVGSAVSFDRFHREVRHWDELGYHFVIGNGTGSSDGLVEVGPRWPKQKWGAHAGVEAYNEFGIGICLVGDFSARRPTAAQLQSLNRLTAFLMQRYRIPPERVIGHGSIPGKKTNCPGKYLDIAQVRRQATAMAGMPAPEAVAAGTELLRSR